MDIEMWVSRFRMRNSGSLVDRRSSSRSSRWEVPRMRPSAWPLFSPQERQLRRVSANFVPNSDARNCAPWESTAESGFSGCVQVSPVFPFESRREDESWFSKFGQVYKWEFCSSAA